MTITLAEAVEHAKQCLKDGLILGFRVDAGTLDVETDQGWPQWWPGPNHDSRYENY